MKKLLQSLIFLVIYFSLFCCTCSAETEQSLSRLVSREEYGKLLDTIFNKSQQTNDLVLYSVVLRFMPSFHFESEVLIQVTNGKVLATLL